MKYLWFFKWNLHVPVCFQENFTWRWFNMEFKWKIPYEIHVKLVLLVHVHEFYMWQFCLWILLKNLVYTKNIWSAPTPPSILYILLKVNAFQVLLILGWSLLVFLSLMIALANQERKLSKQGSTRLRKAFHVLTLLVFVPGLVYDARLLFSASWVAMGVMIIVEVRKGSKKNQQSLLWFQKNYPIWQIY